MPAKPAATAPAHTFETAMTRLESVVEEMGSDQLPLEDLITRYEEGIKLVKVCEERLQAVEKRVEMLTRTASGDPQLAAFDPEKKPITGPREDVSLF